MTLCTRCILSFVWGGPFPPVRSSWIMAFSPKTEPMTLLPFIFQIVTSRTALPLKIKLNATKLYLPTPDVNAHSCVAGSLFITLAEALHCTCTVQVSPWGRELHFTSLFITAFISIFIRLGWNWRGRCAMEWSSLFQKPFGSILHPLNSRPCCCWYWL